MKVKDITRVLEHLAPLSLQESYDNAGLITGSPEQEIEQALITLDVTDEIINEAITNGFQLIIAHHPVIFKGIKKLTGKTLTERLVIKAIKNDIAIYAIHTNLDNMANGVNAKLGEKLGLTNLKILSPGSSGLKKIVVFCPTEHAEKVRQAMFDAGAGHIGNYDSCSFNAAGDGTFRANEGANPFTGEIGKLHFEKEIRIETVVPSYRLHKVLQTMMEAHPYEEVAYDIYSLENSFGGTGAGMIGELKQELPLTEYLSQVKQALGAEAIKHNGTDNRPVKKIAFCGGSGSFLIHNAFGAGADVFITADVKYHDFFEHQNQMVIVDAGHYETEQFTKELLYEIIKENFPTFALQISETSTNPVSFL